MANKEIHYLSCDPEAMWEEINRIYIENGGDALFPGDEKEILLRCLLQVLVTAYAAHDTAARMRTVRYAVSDYLDLLGENMRMPRNTEEAATTTLRLTIQDGSGSVNIPKGSLFSHNGFLTFETTEAAAVLSGGRLVTVDIPARCTTGGEMGNGIAKGTVFLPIEITASIRLVETLSETTGGRNRETDDDYRARLLEGAFNGTVAGPELQYKSRAMAVSSGIVDASAVADSVFIPGEPDIGDTYGLERGQVLVSILFDESVSETDRQSLIEEVYDALSPDDVRPLTDQVIVREATSIPFALHVRYRVREDTEGNAIEDIMAAVVEYKEWQCSALGRAFDPYKLTSMLYNAGCARVEITGESQINGQPAEYTRIGKTFYLNGDVEMEEISDE